MEFNFDVKRFLPERVTKINFSCKFYSQSNRGYGRSDTPSLGLIIDKMGAASSMSQGLNHVITNFLKLLACPDQSLYVMTDVNNAGRTIVVGIMKVGYKNLFVLDLEGKQNELRTLCVLDFYVHESLQRRGFGKQLFDYVLQDLNVNPRHLAIDRPSGKFRNFLAKHYRMKFQIPQANNFVVYDGFFKNRPKSSLTNRLHNQRSQFPRNLINSGAGVGADRHFTSGLPRLSSAGRQNAPDHLGHNSNIPKLVEKGSYPVASNDVSGVAGVPRVNSVPLAHLNSTPHSDQMIGENGDHLSRNSIMPRSGPNQDYYHNSRSSPTKGLSNAFSRYNYDISMSVIEPDCSGQPKQPQTFNTMNDHSTPSGLDPQNRNAADTSMFKLDRPTSKTNFNISNMQYRLSPVEDILSGGHNSLKPLPPLEDSISRTANRNNELSAGLFPNKASSLNALEAASATYHMQNYHNHDTRNASIGSGGKRRFPNAYKTPPSSFNIFGTMPLTPVQQHSQANNAFRTRLW